MSLAPLEGLLSGIRDFQGSTRGTDVASISTPCDNGDSDLSRVLGSINSRLSMNYSTSSLIVPDHQCKVLGVCSSNR